MRDKQRSQQAAAVRLGGPGVGRVDEWLSARVLELPDGIHAVADEARFGRVATGACSPLPYLIQEDLEGLPYSERIRALSARVGFEDPAPARCARFPVIHWWGFALLGFMAADAVVFVAAL
jgi:hypothetical protein